jgi:hypothetical protein
LFFSLEEHQPIDLFGSEPLGILPQPAAGQAATQAVQTEDAALRTWRRCAKRSVFGGKCRNFVLGIKKSGSNSDYSSVVEPEPEPEPEP